MNELRLHAIEAQQNPHYSVYAFVLDGRILREVAAVARVQEADTAEEADKLIGYQRAEIPAHIKQIKEYLESPEPLLPNSLVVAFDPARVRFEPAGPAQPGSGRLGTLVIPYEAGLEELRKPGFMVDGQQRTAAVRESALKGFPMVVSAILTDAVRVQAEQFILTNSGRHLPKGLVYRLLPSTETKLPEALERRKLPALLLERLNREPGPFQGAITTPTNAAGRIRDNSVLRMMDTSLRSGALWHFAGEGDEPRVESMLKLLNAYWGAVAAVFPEAWELKPSQSKLTGGAGIAVMGALMDKAHERLTMGRESSIPSSGDFARELKLVAPSCRWTEGVWVLADGVRMEWNHVENTGRHIGLLTNYLLREYLKASSKGTQRARPGRGA